MQQNLAIPSTVKPATPKAKEEPPPPSRDYPRHLICLQLAFVTSDDLLILDCLFSHLIWSDVMK